MGRERPRVDQLQGPYTRFAYEHQVGPPDDRHTFKHDIVRELDEENTVEIEAVTAPTTEGPETVAHVEVDLRTWAEFVEGIDRLGLLRDRVDQGGD